MSEGSLPDAAACRPTTGEKVPSDALNIDQALALSVVGMLGLADVSFL